MSTQVYFNSNSALNATFCQGSIINTFLILTTAKCLVATTQSYHIVAGAGEKVQRRNVSFALRHEYYRSGRRDYNIGIAVLETPLQFNDYIKSVEFAKNRSEVPSLATTSGWGLLLYGWTSEIVLKNRSHQDPLLRKCSSCEKFKVLEKMRCHGNTTLGSCYGYPGEPIMCKIKKSSPKYVQCGINHLHYGLKGTDSIPTLYTEILYHLDWIRRTVSCLCTLSIKSSSSLNLSTCSFRNRNPASCSSKDVKCSEFEEICHDEVGNGRCVPDGRLKLRYRAHVQNLGWQNWTSDIAGTTNKILRLEALQIELVDRSPGMGIVYQAHVGDEGWQPFVTNGQLAGTTGKSRRVEAVKIKLIGTPHYTIQYRGYVSGGWGNWVVDSKTYAGTAGQRKFLEAIQIRIIKTYKECNSSQINQRQSEPHRVVRYDFKIAYINLAPDGVPVQHVLGINGRFPGPTIRAAPGDILEIKVTNNIQDGQNTTLHWHGLPQAGNPFQDGPTFVTQCPIKQVQSQVYRFPVHHAGTFWYHSHVGSQYTEGLWGVLIVNAKEEQYKYDAEFTVTLNEWYHHPAVINEEWHLSNKSRGAPPYPDSGLMNGYGRYNCTFSRMPTVNKSCNEAEQFRPIFYLRSGHLHRLRLVNTGGWTTYNVSIDGHTFKVIEADGVDLAKPVTVSAVFLGAGQRYSLLIERNKNDKNTSYLIRANLRTEYLFRRPNNINPNPDILLPEITGILQYVPDNAKGYYKFNTSLGDFSIFEIMPYVIKFDHTQTIPKQSEPPIFLTQGNINPKEKIPAPDYFDKEIELNLIFFNDTSEYPDGVNRATFNNTPFQLLFGKPLLMRVINDEPLPSQSIHETIEYGQVVQIVLNNMRLGPHPIHLHGHHFWVVASGKGRYEEGKHALSYKTIRRDTVMVKELGFAVIRFVADNPGVWALHCHIDWHNLSGMRIIIVESSKMVKYLFRVSDEMKMQCLDHDIAIDNSIGIVQPEIDSSWIEKNTNITTIKSPNRNVTNIIMTTTPAKSTSRVTTRRPLVTCKSNEFHCTSHVKDPCISKSKKCDGHWDCWNKEDEKNCTVSNCKVANCSTPCFLPPSIALKGGAALMLPICKAYYPGTEVIVGMLNNRSQECHVPYGSSSHILKEWDTLVVPKGSGLTYSWVNRTKIKDADKGGIVSVGKFSDGTTIYIGRCNVGVGEMRVIGKLNSWGMNHLYVAVGNMEHVCWDFEVLVCKKT